MVLDDIHEAGKRGFRAILLCDLIEPPIQPVSVPVDIVSELGPPVVTVGAIAGVLNDRTEPKPVPYALLTMAQK